MTGPDTKGSLNLDPVGRPRNALATEVYDNLLDALMDGRLAAGDRLVMDRLADDLGVSRSPVRDALLRLHREGVVEPGGRRGYLVRAASDSDIHHFYDARMAVEGFAAGLLSSAGDEVWNSLRALLDDLAAKAAGTVRESFDANRTFHRHVVEMTGNTYLTDMFDTIWNRSRTALTYRDFNSASPYEGFLVEHNELVDNLAGADEQTARATMEKHIACGLERTSPGGAATHD